MTCENIKFGIGNHVELATLTATPEPDTDINFLKNEYRARQTKWSGLLTDTITIEGTLDAQTYGYFFAIPGSNLGPNATVKLELFETDVSTVDVLNMSPLTAGGQIPLGVWEAGVDEFGGTSQIDFDKNFLYWFDVPVLYQKFKLIITHGLTIDPTPPSTGIPAQDEVSGIIWLEAESGTSEDSGTKTWLEVADVDASGGLAMQRSGGDVYTAPSVGPRLRVLFESTQSGLHDVWIRAKTVGIGDPVKTSFEGYTISRVLAEQAAYTWFYLRQITLTAGATQELIFLMKYGDCTIDKIAIQPAGTASPAGSGDPQSADGTEGSSEAVSLRMFIIGKKIELQNNFSSGATVKFTTDPQLVQTESGFYVQSSEQNLARTMSLSFDNMTKADFLTLVDLERQLSGKPFMVSAYPGDDEWTVQSHAYLARFLNSMEYTRMYNHIRKTAATLVEV